MTVSRSVRSVVGFAPDPTMPAEIVHHQVDVSIVAIGHDRGRPVRPTHTQLHATKYPDSSARPEIRSGGPLTNLGQPDSRRGDGRGKRRQRATEAAREVDRAEAFGLVMEGYGGPAQPSPTIAQGLNGGLGLARGRVQPVHDLGEPAAQHHPPAARHADLEAGNRAEMPTKPEGPHGAAGRADGNAENHAVLVAASGRGEVKPPFHGGGFSLELASRGADPSFPRAFNLAESDFAAVLLCRSI